MTEPIITPGGARRPVRHPATLDLRGLDPGAPPRIRRPPPAPPVRRPTITRPVPIPAAPSATKPKPQRRSAWRRLGSGIQYPAFAGAALLAAYSTTFGQWIVLGFVIFAIALRRPSSLSFGSALFLLITIPLFQILHQPSIAENIAVYVFELLVFGVAQAIWELRKSAPENG